MQKTDQDSTEDFQGFFDFDDAFQCCASAPEFRSPVQWGLSLLFLLTTVVAIAFAGFAKLGMGGAIGTVTASCLGAIGVGCLLHASAHPHRGRIPAVCGGIALLAVAIAMLLDFFLQ